MGVLAQFCSAGATQCQVAMHVWLHGMSVCRQPGDRWEWGVMMQEVCPGVCCKSIGCSGGSPLPDRGTAQQHSGAMPSTRPQSSRRATGPCRIGVFTSVWCLLPPPVCLPGTMPCSFCETCTNLLQRWWLGCVSCGGMFCLPCLPQQHRVYQQQHDVRLACSTIRMQQREPLSCTCMHYTLQL